MTETKKKKEAKATNNAPKADVPLSQLLLDCNKDKYRLVSLATRWAQEIKQREQQEPLTPQDLLNKALKEILTGEVDPADIEKLPPVPKAEKKPIEPPSAKELAEKTLDKGESTKTEKENEKEEEDEE